jgi:hypothetical protein
MTKEFHRDWFKWESTNLHDAHSTRDAPIVLKPKVSIFDPKTHLIEVSLSIERSLANTAWQSSFIVPAIPARMAKRYFWRLFPTMTLSNASKKTNVE